MNKYVRILLTMFLLAGCSGTGDKNYSSFAPAISSDEKGKVFVFREGAYVGGGALVSVYVNGINVGQLGTGEALIAEAKNGSNFIQAQISGFQGVGLNSPESEFKNKGDSNNYFVIGLKTGFLSNKLTLYETTESSWINQMK